MTQQDRDIELLKKVAGQIPRVALPYEALEDQQSEAIYNASDQNRAEMPASAAPEEEARAAAERLKAAKDYAEKHSFEVEGDIVYVPMSDEEYNTHMDVQDAIARLKKLEEALPSETTEPVWQAHPGDIVEIQPVSYDAVEPPHYRRGPVVKGHIGSAITMGKGEYSHAVECIEVLEALKDVRLATALKYIWRVGFGGKKEPWDSRSQAQVDKRDIESAIWYLKRYVQQLDSDSPSVNPCYDQAQPNSEGH